MKKLFKEGRREYTTIQIKNELYDRIKILSIVRRKSFRRLVEEAVSEYLEKNKEAIREIIKKL